MTKEERGGDMANELINRFCLGNSGKIISFEFSGDSLRLIEPKQQELIHFGRQQIEIQEKAIREIKNSNIKAADIIANEIENQTSILREDIKRYSGEVCEAIYDTASDYQDAFELLGDRVTQTINT
jgi:hypothetical protein